MTAKRKTSPAVPMEQVANLPGYWIHRMDNAAKCGDEAGVTESRAELLKLGFDVRLTTASREGATCVAS